MEWWERMKTAMMAVGKNVLRYQKSLKDYWISDHTWGLIAQRKLLQQKRPNEINSTSFYRDCIQKTDNSQDVLLIYTEELTEVEVRKAIVTLKTNKSFDMDGITAEMMKAGGETVVQCMCGLCDQIWDSGIVPVD
ncbi:hypothetical protein LSAT2_006659, partial [Lamellibrachia satsuma]